MFSRQGILRALIGKLLFILLFCFSIFTSVYVQPYERETEDTNDVLLTVYDRERTIEPLPRKRQRAHITLKALGVDEDVIITKNPDHYLTHTAGGEFDKGGCLVVDSLYRQSDVATTICGHNTNRKNEKFSNLASLWRVKPKTDYQASYFNGYTSGKYELWGVFRIDQSETHLAYPELTKKEEIEPYLEKLQEQDGWSDTTKTDEVESILILMTCTEPLIEAPHRTVAVFVKVKG